MAPAGAMAIFALAVLSGVPSHGQENNIIFDASASLDWISAEVQAQAGFSLNQAGLRLPAGRFMAEETLSQAYPGLLRPFLLSLRADSNSTIENILERREIGLEDLNTLGLQSDKTAPSLTSGLDRISGRYTIFLDNVSAVLARHRRANEPSKPMIPVQTADYTGIIIIANGELPVHGRQALTLAEPCLFPKIWDTNMNLIYERNMFQGGGEAGNLMVHYTVPESIFRPGPSGLEGKLSALVGPYPLRIIAREVYGVSPTDPVIERDDALKILSSENNRRLLMEGRVVLVLNEEKLKAVF